MSENWRRRTEHQKAHWQNKAEMVHHALISNLGWLAFINAGFAVMILCRNTLFPGYDRGLMLDQHTAWVIDGSMVTVIFFALAACLAGYVRRLSRHVRQLTIAILLCWQSVLWSICAYYFIAEWQLAFAYPFCIILMLTALLALYFFPAGLLLFITPLWLTLFVASLHRNDGVNMRFLVVWLFLSIILFTGRFLLQRWFDEAWQRHSENQLLISRLELQAHQDALTGTANRRVLDDYLTLMVDQHQSFALIMLDVDYFKRFNDHYGHQLGDDCLRQVATVLKLAIRTPEDLVARYGGEEFALVLPDANQQQAMLVAERIQHQLLVKAIPHAASEVSQHVTISIGIAASAGGVAANELIAAADAALYRAKKGGRNRTSA